MAPVDSREATTVRPGLGQSERLTEAGEDQTLSGLCVLGLDVPDVLGRSIWTEVIPMARPIWTGHISFGLVSIPVSLHSAESRQELSFHLLDRRNSARVRYKRVNEETGKEVPWGEIVKAYEYEDGNYVTLEEEDFKKAAVEATQTVDIESFTDKESIDLVYYDRPYYLAPGKKGEKGYVLLREALKRSGKVAIAKVVLRTRQYLAAVIPEGNALLLELLRFQEELRDASDLELPGSIKEQKVSDRELQMAEQLIESMAGEWQPEKFKDDYTEALLRFIEKKVKARGKTVPPQGEPSKERQAARGQIIDMMDLLKKSLSQKSGGSAPSSSRESKVPRKAAKAGPKRAPRTAGTGTRRKAATSRKTGTGR